MNSNTIALAIFFVPLFLLIVSYFLNKRNNKKLLKNIEDLKAGVSSLIEESTKKDREIERLNQKYGSIFDAEKYAQELLDEANEAADSIRFNAEGVLAEAEEEQRQARLKAQEIKVQVEKIKLDARSESNQIIEFAQQEAKRIAGNALEAKDKADLYEKAIRAMRNTIEGYKDDYIIPNHTVLDDLADEFGHKEAGEALKVHRKRIREMVRDGLAGECDYAELNRRAFAINFAVDAFNGKVDTALSKVKHDNFDR